MGSKHSSKVVGAVAFFVFLSLVMPLSLTTGEIPEDTNRINYTPHAPIRIDSNADFPGIATSGDGSLISPWIIENYEINGTGYGYCIYVGNTTEHFVIRNCSLYNARGFGLAPYHPNSGFAMNNVMNGTLWNNIASNNGYGIYIYECHDNNINNNTASFNDHSGIALASSLNITITNNTALNNFEGIYLGFAISSIGRSNYNTISNNNVSLNGRGIFLIQSSNNTLTNNSAFSNVNIGIYLSSANDNIIMNNFVNKSGIFLSSSNNNSIITNTVSGGMSGNTSIVFSLDISDGNIIANNTISDGDVGIRMTFSDNNILSNNTVSWNNEVGISLGYSNNNRIANNDVPNTGNGIDIGWSNNNTIINNSASNNNYGLGLYASLNNTITNNTIFSNVIGFHLMTSVNNLIFFNNIINNTIQAFDDNVNFWDNGYPDGGNYWSDYNGVDFNSTATQDVPPSDGIGDTPYIIDGDSQDNYPFIKPWMPPQIFSIPLSPGWNLISTPLIQRDESIDKVLENITGKWNVVKYHDNTDSADPWKTYRVGASTNDLADIDNTMGFWINITEPNVTLTVSGVLPSSTTINLHAGWNLVSYPSLNTETVGNALWGTGADRVEVFNASSPYLIDEVEATYIMKPGEGYWVHVPADTIWIIDW